MHHMLLTYTVYTECICCGQHCSSHITCCCCCCFRLVLLPPAVVAVLQLTSTGMAHTFHPAGWDLQHSTGTTIKCNTRVRSVCSFLANCKLYAYHIQSIYC